MDKEKILLEHVFDDRTFRLIEISNRKTIIRWEIVEVFKYKGSDYENYGKEKEIWADEVNNIESAYCRFHEFKQELED